ncbi:MAG: DUF2490 domain-containing protein [Brumimicrobium sp.]|nr:DUF2490 domain-containing protein [Brumimicrobium sp.]
MRVVLFISLFVLLNNSVVGQNRFWFSSGVKTTLFSEDLDADVSMHARIFDNGRYDKIFPELSFKYKVNKWFSPSFDYRYVFLQSRTSAERSHGHRVNFNLNTDFDYDRFDFQGRIRAQYRVTRLVQNSSSGYEPDFDTAVRFRARVKYDIKGSKIDPQIDSEFYYNPTLGPFGRQFTKHRFGAGIDINLPNKHELSITYRYDFEFNVPNPVRAHILSLSHSWEYERDVYMGDGL